MTDDDKQTPENDPWADLDIEGDGPTEAKDEFTFNFDGIVEAAEGAAALAGDPEASAVDPVFDTEPADAVPLMVFPPPDADHVADPADEAAAADGVAADPTDAGPQGSEIQIGTGQSGIIPMSAVAENLPVDDFDDQQLARDLRAMDDSHDSQGETDLEALGLGPADDEASEFGDHGSEPVSEDVSFHAGIQGGGSPFAEGGQDDPFAQLRDAGGEEPASIPMHTASDPMLTAAGAAVVSAAASAPARKKKGGLGSVIGVVLGGLMAIPITGLILLGLIWGFQSERFRSVAQLYPSSVLPAKFQPGARKLAAASKGINGGPSLDQSTSLDDLGSLSKETKPADDAGDAGETDAATESAEPEMKVAAADPGEPAEPAEPGTPTDEDDPAEPEDSDDTAAVAAVPDAAPKQPAMAAVDALAALPMAPAPEIGALPAIGALPGLDPPPVAAAPVLPPLDLSGVESAVEQADQAFDAVSAISDPGAPDRKRLLVGWYRKLARMGEELALLESVAVESGRPLETMPEAVASLYDRICGSDDAVSDLGRLGAMWITREKRRTHGVVLVATVESSRRVGPYWCTQVTVPAAGPGGEERSVSAISRTAPVVDTGSRVVITGVMFDDDSLWASDVRHAVPGAATEEVGSSLDPADADAGTATKPSTEEPSTEEPSTEEPSTEEPSTEEPSTEEPSTAASE